MRFACIIGFSVIATEMVDMCTKQDQEKEQGIQLPVSHTLIDHHLPWCEAAWAPCQEWKFFFIKHELQVNG